MCFDVVQQEVLVILNYFWQLHANSKNPRLDGPWGNWLIFEIFVQKLFFYSRIIPSIPSCKNSSFFFVYCLPTLPSVKFPDEYFLFSHNLYKATQKTSFLAEKLATVLYNVFNFSSILTCYSRSRPVPRNCFHRPIWGRNGSFKFLDVKRIA